MFLKKGAYPESPSYHKKNPVGAASSRENEQLRRKRREIKPSSASGGLNDRGWKPLPQPIQLVLSR
jgi:hypothetical protein